MLEPGQRQLLGDRVPTGPSAGFEHDHVQPGLGKVGGADQPVMTGTDDDDISFFGHRFMMPPSASKVMTNHTKPGSRAPQDGTTEAAWGRKPAGSASPHTTPNLPPRGDVSPRERPGSPTQHETSHRTGTQAHGNGPAPHTTATRS